MHWSLIILVGSIQGVFWAALFNPERLGRWIAKVQIGIGKEMTD